jgi:hypothetical protein
VYGRQWKCARSRAGQRRDVRSRAALRPATESGCVDDNFLVTAIALFRSPRGFASEASCSNGAFRHPPILSRG